MTTNASRATHVSETRGLRVVRYALVVLFAFAGVGKLVGLDVMQQTFEHFGYTQDFRLVVGVLETAGAIGLLVPALAFWAALGLSGIMIGAIWSHIVHDPFFMALPALVVLVLLGVIASQRSPVQSGDRREGASESL